MSRLLLCLLILLPLPVSATESVLLVEYTQANEFTGATPQTPPPPINHRLYISSQFARLEQPDRATVTLFDFEKKIVLNHQGKDTS